MSALSASLNLHTTEEEVLKKTIVMLALLAIAGSAQAMSPQVESFLRTAGLDPQSTEVRRADQDGVIRTTYNGDPEEHSLESLAIKGKTNGVKAFVDTREYIRRLKKDFAGTSYEAPSRFDPSYLTPEERKLWAQRRAAMTKDERDHEMNKWRTPK